MLIDYQNHKVEAEEIDTIISNERWNEYTLSDGSTLSLKTILIKVFRATTEKSPDGLPLYLTQTQNILKVKLS